MPSGIYIRTEKHREINRLGHLGKKASEETRKKISEGCKGKGKGRKFTEEHKKKLSDRKKGIKRGPLSEDTKKKLSDGRKGEKNWMWNGGSSFMPYSIDWTNTLRISIRERDKYRCQICGEPQGDRAFPVHHIDYNKENCSPKNLITLCAICHNKTNINREYRTKYFISKM